ncbi:hypothetical protein RRR72_001579 [Citrobacter freundii]|uniref:hypothetical protein n=1 Tax=Citrobacter freundii TaxID=546 RepID=UPI0015E9FF5C|nr:hypothetical protein [Citrobacter freundii]ELJ2048650.1 hypothetical protein [Citrobacter freundii]QMN58986.1 hypothetical protein HVW68_13455 [Citrobacter freundii]HBM9260340.1 hypothetical protein [Citrobacter freundii]
MYTRMLFSTSVCLLLSSCSIDMSDKLTDYQGSDAAYIRVDNSGQPTALRIQKIIPAGNCVKLDQVYGLTSSVAVAGIKSSYSKTVPGIAAVSERYAKRGYLEYAIKPNEEYKIWWKFFEQSQHGIDLSRTWSSIFKAEKGHTYEIGTVGNEIDITDITTGQKTVSRDINECPYTISMMGKKVYE